MMTETALALPSALAGGGFWTPAALFGDSLADRLAANSGIAFEEAAPAITFLHAGDAG